MTMTSEIDQVKNAPRILPALRRLLVFLLLGPLLGVVAVLLVNAVAGGMDPFLGLIVGAVFLFGVQIGALTAIADGLLSLFLPLAARVPLAAVAGAMIAIGSLTAMFGSLPQDMFWPIGGGAAFCTAVCSLLSQDHRPVEA